MAYKNKEDQKKASAEHYQKYKDQYKARAKRRNRSQRKWSREFVRRIKEKMSCVDCGESNPVVLEFDHVCGKKIKNIADMVNQSYSLDSIKEEIRKCKIRCANCHRKKTYERRGK